MKHLILHIGTHKTGTTSLQRFMLENAELIAQQGLGVPQTPSKYKSMNPDRTACFLKFDARRKLEWKSWDERYAKRVQADWACVEDAMTQHDNIYLSDERLWYDGAQDHAYWGKLAESIKELGFEKTTIVVYLRRQEELALSLWAESLKRMYTLSFKDYLKRRSVRRALNYLGNLKAIESAFGKDSIIVREFNRSVMIEHDICRDFCDAIGIEWDESFTNPATLNLSLTNNYAEIKRIANSAPSYQAAGNFFETIAIEASAASPKDSTTFLTEAQLARVTKRYAEDNEEIARYYMNRDDGVLFSTPTAEKQTWSALSPEMIHDMCYFFTEAIAVEHRRNTELEKRLSDLENHLNQLEKSYSNSMFTKLDRRLSGHSK